MTEQPEEKLYSEASPEMAGRWDVKPAGTASTETQTGTLREIRELRKKGYKISIQGFHHSNYQAQQAQAAYNVAQAEQLDDRGIPIGWDYKGQTGPWGQPLPEGAFGWDPHGRPDFGPGPVGWWKREWAELIGKVNISEEVRNKTKPKDDDVFADYQLGLWRDGKIGEWTKAWVGRTASEIRYKWTEMEYSENSPTLLAAGSKFIGSGFTFLGDAFDNVAGAVEYAITPAMLTGDDYIREGKTAITEDWYNVINKIPLVREFSKSLIGNYAAVFDPRYRENIAQYRDTQIWRMGYSASMDVMVRAEYLRRMEQGGEDPRLLAMELGNPAEEMVGRMFLDPLNLSVVASLPGRLAKATKVKLLGRASETARMTSAIPIMGGVMDAVRESAKFIDEFSDSSKILNMAEKTRDGINAVRNGIVDLAQRRGLAALTAQGKRSSILTGSGHFLGIMAEHFAGKTDEFLEYVNSLAKIASDNVDEVTEGLKSLGGLTGDPKLFEMAISEAGTETAILIRNIIFDKTTGKLVDAEKMFGTLEDASDMVAFTNKMYDKMVGATTDIFPTLTQQIKLNDELAELISKFGAGAEEVKRFISKNPFAEVTIPQWQRMMDAAHQFVQPVYSLAAAVQGTLYMGLSPAYWLRNKFTNFAQIFVDQGAVAGFKSLFFSKVHAEDIIQSYLGFVPKIEGFGGAASWAGKAPGNGVLSYFSGKAATDEARAAAHVMATSIRDTMAKGLHEGRIIPSTTGLLSFSDDMRVGIVRLAQQHNGDVDLVWKALREAKKKGGYDIARNLMFLSVDDINKMKQIAPGFHGRIVKDVLAAETLEDAIRALDDVAEDFSKQAAQHWNQGRRLESLNEVYAKIDDAMEGMAPAQREIVKDLISHQMIANQSATNAADEAVRSFRLNAVLAIQNQVGNSEEAVKILKAITDPMDELTSKFHGQASTRQLQIIADHKVLTKTIRAAERNPDIGMRLAELDGIWKEYGFSKYVDLPEVLTGKFMRDSLWEIVHPARRKEIWNGYRNAHYVIRRNEAAHLFGMIQEGGGKMDAKMIDAIFAKSDNEYKLATLLDNAVIQDGKLHIRADLDMQTSILQNRLAKLEKGTDEFKDVQAQIMAIEAKRAPVAEQAVEDALRAGLPKGERIEESEIARKLREAEAAAAPAIELPPVEDIRYIPIEEALGDLPFGMGDDVASPAQSMSQTRHIAQELIDKTKAGLQENWGSLREYTFDARQERELASWMTDMKARMTVARAEALDIAQNTRDFILHNYQKRYGIDHLLSYLYPYHFWHGRTYTKWMKRLVTEPEWIARYARYRQYLEKKNAGLPDWWKYQLNTNDLPGIQMDHPLWFNLEATLNPLYGMTGVDYTDPKRRLDWWSGAMEDLNKVGPSIWTPYQIAAAVVYHNKGKEEASSRWAGRLWTGTRFIRDATALMGVKGGKGLELDPLINFFSGGMDSHERARVGRMLGHMQTEGKYSSAEIIDAGYNQKGPIWDEAASRAINQRAPGQIAAFLLGTGFKPRSESDIQIDRMYNEMYGLMSNRDNLSSEEYRQGWNDLKHRYPFMDAVLLSKKSGLDRDEALAWNVLSRIPPGATDDMAERAGINESDITKFYDNKGDLSLMSEPDRLRFQAAILNLAALLDMPPATTRLGWDNARQAYKAMQTQGQFLYGDNIWDRVDAYYASEDKDSFLRHNPIVEEALDWQQETIIRSQVLAPYYTSIKRIEQYLKGQMYGEAEGLFGVDLWDHFEVWGRLKDTNDNAAKKYWKDHPQMGQYMDFKEVRLPYIAERLNEIGNMIPKGLPAEFRQPIPQEEYTPEINKEAWYESQVVSYLAGAGDIGAPSPAVMDVLNYLQQTSEPLYLLYLGYLNGEELPPIAKEKLLQLGITVQ